MREHFGRKVFWAIGITNEIRLGAFGLVVRPQRTVGLMRNKEKQYRNEGHQIDSTELLLGLKYWL